ncbi:hypothetical protein ACM7MI_05130 [Pseudomonas aeruginosa]
MRTNNERGDCQSHLRAEIMLKGMSLADPAGRLYHLTASADSLPEVKASLMVPNGMPFSPGGELSISPLHLQVKTNWAYDCDLDDDVRTIAEHLSI